MIPSNSHDPTHDRGFGCDDLFGPEPDLESFGAPNGRIRFDPGTLRSRIDDYCGGFLPSTKLDPEIRSIASLYGDLAPRALSVLLVRGMMMGHHRENFGYEAVDDLVEGAEDALERGRTSLNYDRKREVHRDDIVSAGLLEWMLPCEYKYGAPPLLAAAMLLDDDPWEALARIYDLAHWMTDAVDDGYREHLDSPYEPDQIVRKFLDSPLDYLDQYL